VSVASFVAQGMVSEKVRRDFEARFHLWRRTKRRTSLLAPSLWKDMPKTSRPFRTPLRKRGASRQLLGYNASISGGEPRGLILGGGFLQLMD
jgi:hypothetical protein